jgi:hypothetical protein
MGVKMLAFTLAITLAGCSASFQIPPTSAAGAQQSVVVAPAGDEVVVPGPGGATEVIPPLPQCFQRARNFNGLVQRPCADVARETR